MEVGDVVANVFLTSVSECVQLIRTNVEDGPILPDPMHGDYGVLKEIDVLLVVVGWEIISTLTRATKD
jgi:hypothetical protein